MFDPRDPRTGGDEEDLVTIVFGLYDADNLPANDEGDESDDVFNQLTEMEEVWSSSVPAPCFPRP